MSPRARIFIASSDISNANPSGWISFSSERTNITGTFPCMRFPVMEILPHPVILSRKRANSEAAFFSAGPGFCVVTMDIQAFPLSTSRTFASADKAGRRNRAGIMERKILFLIFTISMPPEVASRNSSPCRFPISPKPMIPIRFFILFFPFLFCGIP